MTAHTAPSTGSVPATRMKPGHWVLLVLGVLLTLTGLGLALGGAVLLRADAEQQDGQYLLGDTERYRSAGYALATPAVVLETGQAGMPGAPDLSDLASLQVRATSVVPDEAVFIGIADATDLDDYLADVPHSTVHGTSWGVPQAWPPGVPAAGPGSPGWMPDRVTDDVRAVDGDRRPDDPAAQDFWAVSATGTGTQEVTFDLQPGRWAMVVMNADADRPVWVDLQAGARSDLIGPVGAGLLWAGLVGVIVGIALVLLGAAGLGRDIDPAVRAARARPGQGPGAAPASGPAPARDPSGVHPARITGFLDPPLSRGLWLVKWLLAIPHYLVLALLWPALLVTTVAAGIVILVTGRYPRAWFAFSVGVLRWSWRVGFYGYSALGTDRYPPFTLARAPYPAELDVAYPERLSRGLVLVKWWLLAIPHLLIVGIFTGSSGVGWGYYTGGAGVGWGFSLLGLLVLVVAIVLLFTGRYREETFALVVGLNRWTYRVSAYVLLLRDEYPPFRLDQGPEEPRSWDRQPPSPGTGPAGGPDAPPAAFTEPGRRDA